MEDKYYTPQSEDFSIGLECQVKYKDGWKDRKIRHGEDLCEIISRYTTNKNSVRVWHLNEQDVLDCGFEQIDTKSYLKKEFINNKEFGRDEKIYFGEFFDNRRYIAIENNCGQFYFMGWLKNKIELEKALKQTNVW
jgi:hypothetical protein